MQKTFLVFSCLILALTIALRVSTKQAAIVHAGAAGPTALPTPKELKPGALSMLFDETKQLCDGNQLKSKYTNPTCEGWWEASISESNPDERSFYQGINADACTYGVDASFRCFFKTPQAACKAWAKARDADPNVDANAKKVCGCGALAVNNTSIFNCSYCGKGTMGCNGGGTQFFSSSNCCATGAHPISLSPIPFDYNHAYCGNVVNGPYRNLYGASPESYTVCGTQYSDTYPGMPFVRDQRDKVKDANRTKNGKIKSDLAGFCYDPPKGNVRNCIKQHSTIPGKCEEPGLGRNEYLTGKRYTPTEPQVHHVVPAKDRRGCPCGRNTVKNAVIISAQLNYYFLNHNRTEFKENCTSGMTEIEKVNGLAPYDPLPTAIFAPRPKPMRARR